MDLRYILATLHLLTLGLGVASCWGRAKYLKDLKDEKGLREVFLADGLWGIAALLWLGTGLWRAFGGVEKGTEYYLHNTAFLVKMGLFVLILLLELRPMIILIKWRMQLAKGKEIDLSPAPSLARLTYIELVLMIPIVMMAAAMARGIFY